MGFPSRKHAICKLPVKYRRCSQLRLIHICFEDLVLLKYTLCFQSLEQLYIGGQFENGGGVGAWGWGGEGAFD